VQPQGRVTDLECSTQKMEAVHFSETSSGCYESVQRDVAEESVLCFLGCERAVHVARMGGRDVYRVLVGNSGGKRPLGRPRCRWEDNIKMDLQEVGCGGMVWIELA